MARSGHKYPLIVYRHMLNRWWPAMIAMGLGMFALAYSEYIEPLGKSFHGAGSFLQALAGWRF